MNYHQTFKGNQITLVVLPIEKIRFNIRNLILFKKKNITTNLTTDSNKKNIKFRNTVDAVPSLNDMEFTWTDDQQISSLKTTILK